VHAYTWFLIAGEQISQAKNHLNQSMTMDQLLEAEQRAAEWIRKMRKIPPSSIENPPNASYRLILAHFAHAGGSSATSSPCRGLLALRSSSTADNLTDFFQRQDIRGVFCRVQNGAHGFCCARQAMGAQIIDDVRVT
jgi:hypothetical protein